MNTNDTNRKQENDMSDVQRAINDYNNHLDICDSYMGIRIDQSVRLHNERKLRALESSAYKAIMSAYIDDLELLNPEDSRTASFIIRKRKNW